MVRIKNRYLVVNLLYPTSNPTSLPAGALPDVVQFHAPTPDAVQPGVLIRVIRNAITDLYGDYGMAMAGPSLKVNYWSPATSTAIIRCPREHYQMVWAALTFITNLPKPSNTPVVVRVIRVSGTIRKAEEDVIQLAKRLVQRAKDSRSMSSRHMTDAAVKAVDKRTERENAVLAHVDQGDETGSASE